MRLPRQRSNLPLPPLQFRSEIVVTSLPDKAAQIMGIQFASIAATSCVFAAPEFAGVAQGGVGGVLQAAQGVPWPLVLALGTVNTAGVLFMELVALKDVSAPLTALVYSAEPVYGSALAWWLLGERWGINGWIGAGLIMGSTAYSQFSGDQAEKARAEDL